jgi:hypothetical protein
MQEYADKHDYGNLFKEIKKDRGYKRKARTAVGPTLPAFKDYFQKLLTVRTAITQTVLQYLPQQRDTIDGLAAQFTMAELEVALAQMKDVQPQVKLASQRKRINMRDGRSNSYCSSSSIKRWLTGRCRSSGRMLSSFQFSRRAIK